MLHIHQAVWAGHAPDTHALLGMIMSREIFLWPLKLEKIPQRDWRCRMNPKGTTCPMKPSRLCPRVLQTVLWWTIVFVYAQSYLVSSQACDRLWCSESVSLKSNKPLATRTHFKCGYEMHYFTFLTLMMLSGNGFTLMQDKENTPDSWGKRFQWMMGNSLYRGSVSLSVCTNRVHSYMSYL